ncbi:hypothetical protein CF328_g9653, partial [Tilletia controversa]
MLAWASPVKLHSVENDNDS